MPNTALVLTAKNTKHADLIGLAELDGTQAMALAQLVKRLSWAELRACAISDAEAYDIRDGVAKLQHMLADAGYAPR